MGTAPGKTREVTGEGLERDMAVSTLSRMAILRTLLPRLKPSARVFIWGMPGNGHSEKGAETHLDDLNGRNYDAKAGGFGSVCRRNPRSVNSLPCNVAARRHISPLPHPILFPPHCAPHAAGST